MWIHYSTKIDFEIIKNNQYSQKIHFKPKGLWLSWNNDWLNFCISEKFSFIRSFREVYIDELNINVINNDINLFLSEFKAESANDNICIDWRKVANQYDGIIINPAKVDRFAIDSELSDWLSTFDITSACVWNLKNIKYGKLHRLIY